MSENVPGPSQAVSSAKLSAKFRNERSWSGFPMDVLKSGLQKYIRRNMVDKALMCVGELDLFKYALEPRAEALRTNMIHRLMIIYLEDVGVGDLGLWSELATAVDQLLEIRQKLYSRNTEREEKLLAVMVREMCAAEKARSCSHARAIGSFDSVSRTLMQSQFPELEAMHQEVDRLMDAMGCTTDDIKLAQHLRKALTNRCWTAVRWASLIYQVAVTPGGKSKQARVIFESLSAVVQAKHLPLLKLGERWHQELKQLRESFMTWMLPLVAHITDAPVSKPDIPLLQWVLQERNCYSTTLVPGGSHDSAFTESFAFDDFVLDRHTFKGRSKGILEFAMIGAQVENESSLVNARHKEFYWKQKEALETAGLSSHLKNSSRKPPTLCVVPLSLSSDMPPHEANLFQKRDNFEENVEECTEGQKRKPTEPVFDELPTEPTFAAAENTPGLLSKRTRLEFISVKPPTPAEQEVFGLRETQYCTFMLRAQLTTSCVKSDVYFARHEGRIVVMKGPFSTVNAVKNALNLNRWKQANGFPITKLYSVMLIPDRWPEGVPLGIRNMTCRTERAMFLVSDSLIQDETLLKRRIHSSKLWPPTEVLDGAATALHLQFEKLSHQSMIDYVRNLLFRWLFGVSDLADRNFLVNEGRVLSIDEEYRARPVNFLNELKKKRCEFLRNWVDVFYEELQLASWKHVPTFLLPKYHELLNKDFVIQLF